MDLNLRALLRVAGLGGGSVGYTLPHANEKSELMTAMVLPPYTEMTRKGNGWSVEITTAIAGLVIRPAVTAATEFWNGYPSGGPSLVIDRIWFFNLVSTNVVEGASLWAQVTAPKAGPAQIAQVAATTIRGLSGKAYGGPVILAISTTVIDSGWHPWGPMQTKGAGGVVPFGASEARVEGRLIVPPQCSLCLHVVASLVGDTFTTGASWYEEQLTML